MVIAGHRPTHDGKLPVKKRAGIGAVILAHVSGTPLIPSVVTGKTFKTSIEYAPAIGLTELTEDQKQVLQAWIDGK
jgi:hypothetical protein